MHEEHATFVKIIIAAGIFVMFSAALLQWSGT